jgi:D-beta-D-heptose 7-phosphate kinase / D-beta-D-heptose 1-phosphate adenosyltransferase
MVFDLNDPSAVEIIQVYLKGSRDRGKIVGLTSGSFDLTHFHHVRYLIQCRRSCDILLVGVDSDELVRARKGEGRPLVYDSRRVVVVDTLKPVTFAFILGSIEDFGRAASIASPDIIFKNDSFAGREVDIVGKEYAREIRIVRDVVDHASTTAMIEEASRIVARSNRTTPATSEK